MKRGDIEFRATSNSVSTGISRKGAQLSEVCWIARGTNYLFNGGLPTSLRGSGSGRKDGVVPRERGEREGHWGKRKTTYDVVSDSGQASRRPTVFSKTVCYEAVAKWQIDVRRDRTIYFSCQGIKGSWQNSAATADLTITILLFLHNQSIITVLRTTNTLL